MSEPQVVLVHGLWMSGHVTTVLEHRLRTRGFQSRSFSYPSVTRDFAENVDRLHQFVQGCDAEMVHLVGHSLGGVLILRMLEAYGDAGNGRIVMLGSPLRRSAAAEALAEWPLGRRLLGRSGLEALVGRGTQRWSSQCPLGIIAGTLPMGMGRVFARFEGPHDGTVAVAETELAGAADHITLPVTHAGLLLSTVVAQQTAHFLRCGSFKKGVRPRLSAP